MGIFLDTGFYIGLIDPTDKYYKRSFDLLKGLQTGKFGLIYTSSFIMAESATLVAARTKKNPIAIKEIENFFLGDKQIATILRLNEKNEKDAWEIFQKINVEKKSKVVSFIDCSNIVLCRNYSIDNILSYDPHFDGWLTRVF